MSQIAGQPGLVANQALSLPSRAASRFTPEEQEIGRLIIDAARTQSLVGRQTPGLVGQQAARTGQLLDAPLAPAPSRPAAVSPAQEVLQGALGELNAMRDAPTLLEQARSRGGLISSRDARQLLLDSRREFQGRNSSVNIIRRARLKMQMLDQQRREAKDASALGFRERLEERDVRAGIRSELSLQLSFDRAARMKRSAESQATASLTSVLGEQLRGIGIDRKLLGKIVRNLDRGGPFPQEEILRRSLEAEGNVLEDQVIIMSRAIEAERRSPGLFNRLKVELSAPAKRTAAERLVEQKEQRAREITRLILSMEALGGESLAVVEEEILDLAVETISEASSIQLQLDRSNPDLARRFETLRLRLSTSAVPATPRGSSVNERMDSVLR